MSEWTKVWECEDMECGWVGENPVYMPTYEFLNVAEEEVAEDEVDYVETCPVCEKLALKKDY